MSQTLNLPDGLYLKLAQGAADRGLTIESLLTFVSDMMVMPDRPTQSERARSRSIDRLLTRYGTGPLTEKDRAQLDQLIDADYHAASTRADRLIAAKKAQLDASPPSAGATAVNSSPRSSKRLRK
jgi:hypothetical protein